MKRTRADLHGLRPKEKFTCGLNVSQEEWDRIFGTKKKQDRKHKLLTDGRSECKTAS